MNGVLTIELRREIPEALRPRKIKIGAAPKARDTKTIDHQPAKAA